MDKTDFDDLLKMVSPLFKRRNTFMREAIRLSLTLRYLATGKMRKKKFISSTFQKTYTFYNLFLLMNIYRFVQVIPDDTFVQLKMLQF